MGFLSRKKKNREPAVVEETHPLEEELQGMEEAVPERRVDEYPDPEPAYREPEPEYQDDIDVSAPTAGPPPADDAVAADVEPPAAPVEEKTPEAAAPASGGVAVG